MINFREEKNRFFNALCAESEPDEDVLTAVSMGIGFLAKNYTAHQDIPIVLCAYSSEHYQSALKLLQLFFRQVNPSVPEDAPELNHVPLHLTGDTTEQSLVKYCRLLRERGPSLFYWADSTKWFEHMPSGMFYVIDFNGNEVVAGLNHGTQVNAQPEIIPFDDSEDMTLKQLSGLVNMTIPAEDAHMLFYREADAGIVRVVTAPEGDSFDPVITHRSPDWQKEACVALRRYLARECNYGMKWDASYTAWKGVEVHPLIIPGFTVLERNETAEGLVGIIMFGHDGDGKYALSSVWIHPFYRRKGLLEKSWHGLVARYGQFPVEQPNANMQAFLKRVEHQGKMIGVMS